MISIKSQYFGEIEISGEQEQLAADWLSKELKNATKSKEILTLHEARQQFNVIVHPTNSHVKESDKTIHCLL